MKNTPSINDNTQINSKESKNESSEMNFSADSQELDPYSLFVYSLRSPYTKESYTRRLKKFFEISGLNKIGDIEMCCTYIVKNTQDDPKWLFNIILKFSLIQKERVQRREITGGTLRNYLKTIKTFCEINDIDIPWKKIMRGLPRVKRYADDRAPTIEEIRKILEYPDRRLKSIVTIMASSGIRVGAWDHLQYGHIQEIKNEVGDVIAAKIRVYAEEDDEYLTFITPEAYFEVKSWIEYREKNGEKISNHSWVMRNLWDVTSNLKIKNKIENPIKLQSIGIKRLLERALRAQGIRTGLYNGKKRYEFQVDHGYRKFFKTKCEQSGMKPINIEILMGHSTGISDSYYRATEKELLDDYLKAAADNLLINEQQKLENQINEINQNNTQRISILQNVMKEKEIEIERLKEKDLINSDSIASLSDKLIKLMDKN